MSSSVYPSGKGGPKSENADIKCSQNLVKESEKRGSKSIKCCCPSVFRRPVVARNPTNSVSEGMTAVNSHRLK